MPLQPVDTGRSPARSELPGSREPAPAHHCAPPPVPSAVCGSPPQPGTAVRSRYRPPPQGGNPTPGRDHIKRRLRQLLLLAFLLPTAKGWCWNPGAIDLTAYPVTTYNGKACGGTRAATNLNCTAKEFTVSAVFSASEDTPRMCVQGSYFLFKVDLELSGSNTDRYDPVFYAGENLNSPQANNATNLCSVAAVPQPFHAPWTDLDGVNTCGDYPGAADSVVRFNEIKVKCQGDASGFLTVPYMLAYEPKAQKSTDNPKCTYNDETTNSYPTPSSAKCVAGTSTVSGSVSVFSGGFVDVEKRTVPAGESQTFSFSASGPSGAQVMALTDFTVPAVRTDTPVDGTATPAYPNPLTASVNNIGLGHGQTARFYINALGTSQLLTITEAQPPTSDWESTASISCNNLTGTPITEAAPNQNPNPNNATRTITANISANDSAAYCIVTNYKRAKVQIRKTSANGSGIFAYSMTNLGAGSDTITTTTANTPVDGAINYVVDRAQTVAITETAPADWPANPVSASCVDTNYAASGNVSTAFGSLAGNILTIPTANLKAGAQILCSFTNTKPVIQIEKTSNNGTGTFNYTLTNMTTTSDAITTSVAGTAVKGIADNVVASAATAVTITETAPAGWPANPVSASCIDNNAAVSGNPAPPTTFGSLAGTILTIPTANLKAGAQILCSFVNTAVATITVNKALAPSGDGGKFTLRVAGVAVATDISNGGSGSATVPANNAVTVDEIAGSGTSLVNYSSSYSCSGGYTATNVPGTSIAIPAANLLPGAAVSCTFSNTRKSATLTLQKTWVAALVNDAVTVTATGLTSLNSTANTANETDSGSPQTVYAGSVITLDENFTSGTPANYGASLACSGTAGLSGTTLTVGAGDSAIVCTYTNTYQVQPLLVVLKSVAPGNPKPGDIITYTVQVNNSGGPATNVILTDSCSPYTALRLNYNGSASSPFEFVDRTAPNQSGLSLVPGASISYSSTNGSDYAHPLTDQGDGFDGTVTNWQIVFSDTMNMGDSGFTLRYQMKVK